MKNILLLAHDDAGQEARLQTALDLTRALGGHLVCLDIACAPASVFVSAEAQAAVLEDESDREAANRSRLAERLAGEDVSWSLESASGQLADSVIDAAGLADLIVVSRRLDGDEGPDMLSIASAILLNARTPVVAVPQSCRGFDAAGHAVVAWDGSLPAMAALTAAIPLLKLASGVSVVEIQGEAPRTVEEAAAYLSRHDIHADVDLVARFKEDGMTLGEVVAQQCQFPRAAYCVMGAYGHSPVREALLGGVTRHMLGHSQVPLFMAH